MTIDEHCLLPDAKKFSFLGITMFDVQVEGSDSRAVIVPEKKIFQMYRPPITMGEAILILGAMQNASD